MTAEIDFLGRVDNDIKTDLTQEPQSKLIKKSFELIKQLKDVY